MQLNIQFNCGHEPNFFFLKKKKANIEYKSERAYLHSQTKKSLREELLLLPPALTHTLNLKP